MMYRYHHASLPPQQTTGITSREHIHLHVPLHQPPHDHLYAGLYVPYLPSTSIIYCLDPETMIGYR
jgi:hypothetical protein